MPQNAKGTIFINYRRDDSGWPAQTIYNELQKYFSRDQIFKDFNAIQPGDDFVESITGALQSCDVLLVLIGPKWLDMKDASGRRRLDDPDDFVRLEIAKALTRKIKVVPVMLDDTKMPRTEELPELLQSLTRRQLVEVDTTRFDDDIRKLAMAIKKILQDCGYDEEDGPPKPKPDPVPDPKPPKPHPPIPHPKPDNNMVWAILATILCCPPLGIVAIISAAKVDSLYQEGKYEEAMSAAQQAKKWAMWGAGISIGFWILYLLLLAAGVVQQPQN